MSVLFQGLLSFAYDCPLNPCENVRDQPAPNQYRENNRSVWLPRYCVAFAFSFVSSSIFPPTKRFGEKITNQWNCIHSMCRHTRCRNAPALQSFPTTRYQYLIGTLAATIRKCSATRSGVSPLLINASAPAEI